LVGVISLTHGAVLDAAMGAYKGKGTGEHGLFRRLSDCFVAGDVMLADGYFCSYFLIAEMHQRGVDVPFEQRGARITDFRRGEQLGVRDHRVNWEKPQRPGWMSVEEYRLYPDETTLREVKVDKKVLVTTFLNPRQTPKRELGQLFWQRWNVGLDLRNVKSTLGMELFSCKTRLMVEKELWVYLLAYNLIRLLMAETANQAGALPRQLSFKHTLQTWVQERTAVPLSSTRGHCRLIHAHRTNRCRRSTWQARATADQAQTEAIHVLGCTALESQAAHHTTRLC
jgi:hypothetical protein